MFGSSEIFSINGKPERVWSYRGVEAGRHIGPVSFYAS